MRRKRGESKKYVAAVGTPKKPSAAARLPRCRPALPAARCRPALPAARRFCRFRSCQGFRRVSILQIHQ